MDLGETKPVEIAATSQEKLENMDWMKAPSNLEPSPKPPCKKSSVSLEPNEVEKVIRTL